MEIYDEERIYLVNAVQSTTLTQHVTDARNSIKLHDLYNADPADYNQTCSITEADDNDSTWEAEILKKSTQEKLWNVRQIYLLMKTTDFNSNLTA